MRVVSGAATLIALSALAAGPPRVRPAPKAEIRLEQRCNAGNLSDCLALGSALASGQGVPVDWPRALGLYEKACPGRPEACYYLGLVYLLGAEVLPDPARAARHLETACDGGVVDACVELASAYDQGRPGGAFLPRDPGRARSLFEKARRFGEEACEKGDLRGCGSLAWLYTTGSGVARDLARAARLVQKGCDGGDLTLCRRLGNIYASGAGVARDTQKARQLLERACASGIGEACRDVKRVRWAEITGAAPRHSEK